MDVARRLYVARRLKPARYIALYAALTTACVWPSPERQLLLDFFQACRVYDTTVLARLATVSCNPKTDGVVQEFEVVSVDRAPDARNVTIRARVPVVAGAGIRTNHLRGHGPPRWPLDGDRPYATSSFANFARSVFCPTEVKRTTSLVSSSSASTLMTVPSPNFGCLTLAPGRRPSGTDWFSSSYA